MNEFFELTSQYPFTSTLIVAGGLLACGFVIGKKYGEGLKDETIERTIDYLIQNNFVKWKKIENDEIELIPLDEKD